MNVLITGATGFIGVNLAKHLASKGYNVHALYRNEAKILPLKLGNVMLFKGDVTNKASLEKAMENCDYVIHLAAYAKVWSKDPNTFHLINYIGTENVLKVARTNNVKRVIVTSTAGVLGPSLKQVKSENSSRDVPYFNEYEQTKGLAEELVQEHVKEGQDVVIVNPTRVFGPGLLTASNSVTKMIMLYTKGKFRVLPGNGKSKGNYVYIRDVIKGIELALEKGKIGERYILGGENVSYIDFFETLAEVTGKRYKLFKLPLPLMLFVSGLMLFVAKIFKIPPLITPKWVRKYNYNWELSSDKAIEELGYTITPIETSFAETVEYLRQNRLIKDE